MTSKNEIRLLKIKNLLTENPDRVPIIVRPEKSDNVYRFLVKDETTLANFMIILRKKIKLESFQSIYIFVKSGKEVIFPPTSSSIGTIYHQHKDQDLVLNLVYAKENVFG